MKSALAYVAVLLLVVGLMAPLPTLAANGNQGVFCALLGWLVQPIGWCATTSEIVVVTHDKAVVTAVGETAEPMPVPVVQGVSTTVVSNVSTSQPLYQPVTNEYLTIEQSGVSESLLNRRITEVLEYINSLPHATGEMSDDPAVAAANALSSREYVLKSNDRVYDRMSDMRESIVVAADFTSPSITDGLLSGTTFLTGRLGLGTSSPSELLSIDGAIYLAATTPTNFANRLYNTGGDLYWNGTVLSGSTTANWSAASGDVFRLSGNVGIGTTSPTETLTVAGTLSAGTTTARILDTGGAVCNVEAYGAVGDNSTINDAAIASAIAACPEGGTVFFPMGEFRISSPIVLDRPVTLRGAYSPRWSYSSTPRSSIRADFGSFAGVAMVHVRDRTISGQAQDNNGGRLEYINLDGGSASTNVDGIYFEGLVRDWKLTDVDISQVTGNGFEAAVGAGSGNPRGFTIRGLSIYSADGHGFRATALNDSYVEDLLAVGNALRGIYLSSMGETKINNSRAVFNGLTGLYIDGSSNNGGMMFTDFSTDRNDRHGVRISLTGTTTVTFNGLLTRRDGANTSGGTETPYAGVTVIGTTTAQVAPVFINGLSQIIGVDDAGAPPLAPLTGVRVSNASYVKVEGQLWGVNEAYRDDGGNDNFIIEEGSIVKVGEDGVTETSPPLYHNKWMASSTAGGLLYDGKISIGSSTDSRLLNIVAPSAAGARFRDTTNNVIFDMRAEDYQGFFGTFSNHQLRFQTNNLSRLTIDLDGDIGIGTTSPDQALDVIGTIQSSDLLGGVTNLTTDVNGNIIRDPSDQRLKSNIKDVNNALEKTLALRGVTYEWLDKDRFGDQMEIGFIAQEVDKVVPEAVRKGGDYWSLNTRNLLAVAVEAIEEVWQTVTGNQQRITELEERLAKVEAELDIESAEPKSVQSGNDSTPSPVSTESEQEAEQATTTTPTTATSSVEVSVSENFVATTTDPGVVEDGVDELDEATDQDVVSETAEAEVAAEAGETAETSTVDENAEAEVMEGAEAEMEVSE